MDLSSDKFSRLLAIYDLSQMEKLKNAKVAVVGLGGVGSYCALALARSCVGTLKIIDFDTVSISNINRQLFANDKTVGMYKADVAEKMIFDVNPDIKVIKVKESLTSENASKILSDFDYIVDAIDDVPGKIEIAKYAQENSVSLVSCMGTALRTDPFKFQFADIYKTSVCPLCRKVRKLAKENRIKKLRVLYSKEPAVKSLNGKLGSTSFIPPIAGFMLASKVIEDLVS